MKSERIISWSCWRCPGEVLAPLLGEGLEVGLVALRPVAQQAVEIPEHLPHALPVLRREIIEPLLHPLEEGLEHLLLERAEQLLEEPLGLGIGEGGGLEALDGG